jgi:chromosome segregation protein
LLGQVSVTRDDLRERVADAAAAQLKLAATRAEYDAAKLRLGEYESLMREVRARIDHTVSSANALTVQERELALAVDHLLESVHERHRVDVRRVLTDFHARELPDGATHERVDELLRLVERMGEINLVAIEEYEERATRHEYLTAQRTDLETALTQLDKAIRQMNRESRRLFRETFDAVNSRFQHMFPRMFGGGRAELKLTSPDDLLESGIEIYAQPPGKKLGSLELMSGGEKALTAVSLIFAIFQFKPSPFCLLDEVDAPLDEANIARFCDMIREMTSQSQFILITHSKRTMELGDVLYGVTMETPGISKLVSVELRNRPERAPSDGERHAAVA